MKSLSDKKMAKFERKKYGQWKGGYWGEWKWTKKGKSKGLHQRYKFKY